MWQDLCFLAHRVPLFARTLRGDESQELQSKLRGCPGFAGTDGVLAASASRSVTLLPSSVPKDRIPARVELLNATLTPLAWKRSPTARAGAAAPAALQELAVAEGAGERASGEDGAGKTTGAPGELSEQ